MRSDQEFLKDYRSALAEIDPASEAFEIERLRTLGQTELCLAYCARFLPDEPYSSVPFLMMGYPSLLAAASPEAVLALASVRHLCSRFGSVSAWIDATMQYQRTPETLRCFDLREQYLKRRTAAPQAIQAVLDVWLRAVVPSTNRTLRAADPGEATVLADRGRVKLSYTIPPVAAAQGAVRQHKFIPRAQNPPIRISLEDIRRVASIVDARESRPDWPRDSLPPLRLADRLGKLQPKGLDGFFDGEGFTLDGAVHVVGMLSSGKSTLVMGILFALALGGSGKRVAVLVGDTIQGASLAARLRRHGVVATVLSSLRNREGHLQSIHWQRGLDGTGWQLSRLGDLAEGFGTACPLDGAQNDPELIEGEDTNWRFPGFVEKQCHRLYQKVPPDDEEDGADPDDVGDSRAARSCPLWAQCPAQEQQRSAVDAQVLIMTPQAFVHITPDKWTTERHVSLPELLQFEFDLVIADEVDSIQKSLDDLFAPRSPIMGDERDVYAPSIGLRSSEALRERSGVQFRKPVNARWQSNFFMFFRLVGIIYAMLQNEREQLKTFYEDSPFTAGGILYELWRRRRIFDGVDSAVLTFENPTFAREFLDVIKVAGAISLYSKTASVAEEDRVNDASETPFHDKRYAGAAAALQDIARQILVADYYDALLPMVEDALDHDLSVFNGADTAADQKQRLDRRGAALALLLATVTDLALAHYNWLVKTQSAVARDFKIDDGHLLGQANSLIRNYRTLLPSNPAGAAFGLFYDEPRDEQRAAMGGKLTLISHLGVGRHLITHLHDLLAAEGQAGPHVLMLSGTSWAGGGTPRPNPKTGQLMDAASPSFDVQVPVKGVLVQPQAELEAIRHSAFSLISVPDSEGRQIGVSGQPQNQRRKNLAAIAERFAVRRDGTNRLEDDWRRMAASWAPWSEDALENRRRALLVTNSYADAAVVAEALAAALEVSGYAGWKAFCLVRDREESAPALTLERLALARAMPRSLVERFGLEPEHSILIAPMQVIARGHNILNAEGRAAISAIYFLHRPHPRPDDLGPTIGRLNRFAQARYDHGVSSGETLAHRARSVRYVASRMVREGLEAGRSGYRTLPAEFKAQFAWDMLTPLWQTIGRGIRGGSPVHIGFVDNAFAPLSFDSKGAADTPESSVLVQCLRQLELAMDPKINPREHEVARLLYQPFHDALAATKGLRIG